MLIHVRISEGVQSEFFFHQTDGPFKWGGGEQGLICNQDFKVYPLECKH